MPAAPSPVPSFEDRFLGPEPSRRSVARELYDLVAADPLVCPHGHVDPALFVDPDARFPDPAALLVTPDHYIFRMLYSQGVPLEELGVGGGEVDPRTVWKHFAAGFRYFRGTPVGVWLRHELRSVFGVEEDPSPGNAEAMYDHLAMLLAEPEFSPRRLFERFRIEVLCTTDAATDDLASHRALRDSGWAGRVLPTFRPDALLDPSRDDWCDQLDRLADLTGREVGDYAAFVAALEERRRAFQELGATSTDHAVLDPSLVRLGEVQVEALFRRARRGELVDEEARAFEGHMLFEMARMSCEDGLVMQLHPGSLRNHNPVIHERFGADRGADIPVAVDFTRGLRDLLASFGNDRRLSLILFTLDESTYSRELAPLAGHYPAVKLGPPWWFHDSVNGMRRYFDQVMETAGLYNTAGFNDDTRAFPSIPARHDLWRRVSCDWLAGLVLEGRVDLGDAHEMAGELATGLARRAYKLELDAAVVV